MATGAKCACKQALLDAKLSFGTANDLAGTLSIPEAIDDAFDIAAGDDLRAIDVGE